MYNFKATTVVNFIWIGLGMFETYWKKVCFFWEHRIVGKQTTQTNVKSEINTCIQKKLLARMPNVMAALANIGGALCSTPQSWNLQWCLKLANWSQPLVGRSSPYCGDMWRTYCSLTCFFPSVDTCLTCEDIARQSCAMVPRWRFLATFLRPVFSASRLQQVSDLHLKFAQRPHNVWKYGRHPICGGWD